MDAATATLVAEDVIAAARDTIDDVIESVRDFTSDVREAGAPKKKNRHPFLTLLILLGLGAIVYVVIKKVTAPMDEEEALEAIQEDVAAPASATT